jgi:hypothetical protein
MMTNSVEKTVEVPLPPVEAFDLFTTQISTWWPSEIHSTSAGDGWPAHSIDIEPYEGGQIIETRHDGQKSPWATITKWSRGKRFTFDWHVGRHPQNATQVDVIFTPSTVGTRVNLTHTEIDALAIDAITSYGRDQTGWDTVWKDCRASACQKKAA